MRLANVSKEGCENPSASVKPPVTKATCSFELYVSACPRRAQQTLLSCAIRCQAWLSAGSQPQC